MARLSRMCATGLTTGLVLAGLVFAAQANADSPWTEFTVTENFPCLGEPGDQDDLAVISGVETSNNGVGIWHVTVDPVAEGLPDYTGLAINGAHETANQGGENFFLHLRFVATAVDGSDRFTFHFGIQLNAGHDGELRSMHVMDKFCSNE